MTDSLYQKDAFMKKICVDEMGVDEEGVDEIGSRISEITSYIVFGSYQNSSVKR